MKAFKLGIVAVLLGGLSTALFAEEAKTQTEKDSLEIRIAKLDIINIPITEALAKVTELSKEADPAKKGVSILLDPRVDASTIKAVSLNLKDVPLYDVIRVISALSGLQPKYEDNVVILVAAKPAS